MSSQPSLEEVLDDLCNIEKSAAFHNLEQALAAINRIRVQDRLDELDRIKEPAISLAPKEPSMPRKMTKESVDKYNKESAKWLGIMADFDRCFQPVMEHRRKRTVELQNRLTNPKEENIL